MYLKSSVATLSLISHVVLFLFNFINFFLPPEENGRAEFLGQQSV